MSEVIVPRIVPPWPFEAYAHVISPLSAEDGGGFFIGYVCVKCWRTPTC